MAEVRPIASAVGAYEAQVLNMTGAYNQLLKMQAQQAKSSEAMRKRAEDDLNSLLRDKRTISQNDSTYIEGLRKDVQDYFFQNKEEIYSNTKTRNEFYNKLNHATSEYTKAVRKKEQGVELNRYYLEATKTGATKVSNEFEQRLAMFNRPINDSERKAYTFTNANKVDVGIDELGVLDLNAIAVFSPTKLDERIRLIPRNIKSDESFVGKRGKKYVGQDITKQISFVNPAQVAETVIGTYVEFKQSFTDSWKDRIEIDKVNYASSGLDLQTAATEDLNGIIQLYKDAGVKLPEAGMPGSIESIFMQDGVPGVDINNPLEYAALRSLESTLPQYLGESYSYKTQQMWISAAHLKLAQADNARRLQEYRDRKDNTNFDDELKGQIKDAFKSGNLGKVLKEWEASLNSIYAIPSMQTGYIPANFSFDEKSKTMTLTIQKPLLSADQEYVTDGNIANKYKTPGTEVKLIGGIYISERKYTRSIDPDAADFSSGISEFLNIGQEAQPNASTEKFIETMRNGNTKGVLNDLLKR